MKFSKTVKQFSFVGIGKIIGSGLSAIFYILFALILEPSQYGELAFLIAIAQTTSIFSRFGFNHTITIFQGKQDKNISEQINNFVLLSTSVASIFLLFINPFVALLTLSMSFFVMGQHNLLGKSKYKFFMNISILQGLLHLFFVLIMFAFFNLEGILIGMCISNLICCFPFFKSFSKFNFNFGKLRTIWKTSIHNFGVDASTNLSRRIDKIMIAPIFGFTSVGIFQFNTQILFALELIPLALHSFLLSEESRGNKSRKLIFYLLILSIVISICIFFLSPIFVNQFFSQYSDGIFSLQILGFTIIPLTISSIFSAKLQVMGSTKVGFAALIRIGSIIILIPILGNWFDLAGLSLSLLISSIFYSIFLGVLYKKLVKIS